MPTAKREKPVRVGVFSTVAAADQAVNGLLRAGFSKEQITVICSDTAKERHFEAFHHEDPAGSNTPAAVLTGGGIGAALGGLAALVGVVATGGIGLLAAGGIAAWAGGAAGGLVGAMMTRGVEKAAANFYDEAVAKGKILVAAEVDDADDRRSLNAASRVLAEAGAEPLALRAN